MIVIVCRRFFTLHSSFFTFSFELSHLEREQIPSGDPFLWLALGYYPLASLHYTHTVRNEHVAVGQRLSKELVLTRRVIRMGIDRVDEQFTLWQRSQFGLAAQNL